MPALRQPMVLIALRTPPRPEFAPGAALPNRHLRPSGYAPVPELKKQYVCLCFR
jgi:hypothetical protein